MVSMAVAVITVGMIGITRMRVGCVARSRGGCIGGTHATHIATTAAVMRLSGDDLVMRFARRHAYLGFFVSI
jgi:hypothetical protein